MYKIIKFGKTNSIQIYWNFEVDYFFYKRYQTYWFSFFFFLPDNLWFNHGWIKFIEVAKKKKKMTIDLSWMMFLININKLAEKLQSYKQKDRKYFGY